MTRPKPSYSTNNMKTPICTKLIACDGDNLNIASRERGYCGKCRDAMEKRKGAKTPKPLRGENTALYGVQRRTVQKPKGEEQ